MAELKRKDEELTTADLAGRSDKLRDSEDRPQLVRNQPTERSDYDSGSPFPKTGESGDTRFPVQRSTDFSGRDTATPLPMGDTASSRPVPVNSPDEPSPLFAESEVGDFRSRWSTVQAAFVDDPRHAVEDADNLVASLMKKLAEGFANERERLEKQWDSGDNVSTEDLRLALQRYRSFFDRLLKV